MIVPNGTVVMVLDGAKMSLLRNDGDALAPILTRIEHADDPTPSTAALGSDMGAAIGGAASIGLMAAVNFTIDSDFKWVLLAIALAWACSLVLFWFETRTRSG